MAAIDNENPNSLDGRCWPTFADQVYIGRLAAMRSKAEVGVIRCWQAAGDPMPSGWLEL
jgi:hypothetical protein